MWKSILAFILLCGTACGQEIDWGLGWDTHREHRHCWIQYEYRYEYVHPGWRWMFINGQWFQVYVPAQIRWRLVPVYRCATLPRIQ